MENKNKLQTKPIELKKTFELKNIDTKQLESGIISGIANKVDIIDLVGDKIIKGAFTKTVKEKSTVWLLNNHISAFRLGVGELKELDNGDLWIDAKINMDTQDGKDAYNHIKVGFEKGLNPAFSIGGSATKWSWVENNDDSYREIQEFEVKEVSLVNRPANPDSLIETIKENIKGEKEMSVKDLKEKDPVVKSDEVVDEAVEAVKEVEKGEGCSKSADEVVEKSITNNYYTVSKSDETKEEKVDEELKSFELLQAKGLGDYDKVKALGTSNLTSQTVLPTGTSNKIIDKLKAKSQLFDLLDFAPTKTGSFEFAVSGNYGTAGATAEAGNYVDGDESVSTIVVNASKVSTIQKVSEEALTYSPSWFADWLTNRVVSRLKAKVEDYLIDGSGSSNQPLGLFRQTAITQKITTATRGTITLAEIEGLLDAISLDAKDGAVLIMNPKTWSHILNKKATDGHYVFRDFANYQDPSKLTFRGYKVVLSEKAHAIGSASGDASKNLILFGNISNADYFGAVLGWNVNFQVLKELYAASGSVGYRASLAFGFKILQSEGFAYLTNKS